METTKEINASQSSCKISINAKGQWSCELKAYADTLEKASKLALDKAEELQKILEEKNGGKPE